MGLFKAITNKLRRKPVNALPAEASGYGAHGASYARKSLAAWLTAGRSADEDIVDNIETLRNRSRDLFMGAPLATGAIKTVRTNVVGSGLALNAQIDAEYLGLSEDAARAWETNVEREWRLWAESTDCDIERRQTFYQLQSLVLMSALVSGDVFVTLPVVKWKHSPYDLRVALIEADRVCNPEPVPHDANILGGVETGAYGEPVAYWVAKNHPGAFCRNIKDSQQSWKRVPAYGAASGRRNIMHIMSDVERPAQRRGVPMLAPVVEALKQLSRYSEAELMAAVVSGMFTVFITSERSDVMPGQHFAQPLPSTDELSYELGNGAIVGLQEGERIETANPGRPNAGFDGFVIAICRQIGAALEIPYELLVKNFQASYSASRAALLEAWKMFRMRREWLVGTFCQPVYEEWLREAVLKGRIDAPGFLDDPAIRAAWCGAEWYGDAQGQLDPLKEANAAAVRVEKGFSTCEREAAELTGLKYEAIIATRKREEDMRREAGLTAEPVQPSEPAPQEDQEVESNESFEQLLQIHGSRK